MTNFCTHSYKLNATKVAAPLICLLYGWQNREKDNTAPNSGLYSPTFIRWTIQPQIRDFTAPTVYASKERAKTERRCKMGTSRPRAWYVVADFILPLTAIELWTDFVALRAATLLPVAFATSYWGARNEPLPNGVQIFAMASAGVATLVWVGSWEHFLSILGGRDRLR